MESIILLTIRRGTKNISITVFAFLFLFINSQSFAQNTTPVGTQKVLGTVDGLNIGAKVQSPSMEATPLQIICLFEYAEGDITNSPPALPAALNGMLHVDHALKGIITDIRKSGRFEGRRFETLILTPPEGTIPARKLLLIGLGDRNAFNADLMTDVGMIGMREALRLGVSNYSHASDLKDAGIDSPTGEVAANVVKGALNAYETELYLYQKGFAPKPGLTSITLLAGPAFFTPSGQAIENYLSTLKDKPTN